MRRTVIGIFTLLLLTLLAPYRAGALGLGDIKLSSYLNQPLKAQIGLLPAQAGELDDTKIGLAPNDAFERAGIERRDVLDQLSFKVVKGADGRPVIQVTSQQPIKEPFLDFILQVTWPNGRLLREYTVLLDPPVTTPESAPPIQPAVSATTTVPAETATQAAAPAPVAGEAGAVPEAAAAGIPTRSIDAKLTHDAYGPTQRTDTLWSIAKTVRPNGSVSVQQVMLALVKNNPDAFYNDNVNTLKAGYVLRLPDLALINQVDEAQAIREVKHQYQQWQDMKAGKLPAAGAAANNAAPAKPASEAAGSAGTAAPAPSEQQARLKLLPPDAGQTAAGGTSGTTAGDGKSTQDRLATALEANEAQKQENASLRSRISELSDQVQSMQRLLALKDDTLAVLQNKLGQTQNGAAMAQTAAPQNQAATTAQPTQPVQQQAKPAGPPPPTVVKPPVHAAPKPQQSGGLLSDPKIMGVGGAVVLLLGALGWLAIRRRKMKSEALMAEETAAATAEAQESDEKTVRTEEYSPTGGDLLEAEVNEIDPLAEADVYMAYRRYAQAEELLKGAIDQEPKRQELRLKLLEVHAAAENSDAFTAEAENFYNEFDGRDNPLWQKVVSMGREVSPEHPLFTSDMDDAANAVAQAGAGTSAPAEGDEGSEFSMDVDTLAMDDAGGAASDGDDPDATAEIDLAGTEEELTFLETEQQADEPVTESGDAVLDEDEAEQQDENLAIDFEPGLDKVLPDQASASDNQEEAEPFKTGNEIDFDSMVSDGEQSDAQAQPVVASSDETPSDGPDDGLTLDTADGLDDVELSDDDGGLVFIEGHKDEDGVDVVAEGDATGDLSGQTETDEGDDGPGSGKLDFNFDLGSLATKDKDLDDFFEGLDSGDEGHDGSGGHEEVGTKLDLAKAFIEMGDQDGAKDILKEVVDLGDDEQKQEAQGLLQQLEA